MRIVQFEPEHLKLLLLQPSQAIMQPTLSSPDYAQSLRDAGPAYSLVDGDVVFASAGFIPQWENRAVAWALIAEEVGTHMVMLHKAVRRALTMHTYRRVETAVACNFPQGHRWAELLGFEREGRMRAFTPDGMDCDLYARVVA
jgi:hypothetical protein